MTFQAAMLGAVASMVCVIGGEAMADAHVVTRGGSTAMAETRIKVMPSRQTSTQLVVSPMAPHEVRINYANSTTVVANPAMAGFIRSTDGVDQLDDNHSILRALRLAESLRAKAAGATLIRGGAAEAMPDEAAVIRPILRFRKPADPARDAQPMAMAPVAD
ncbi:MAG: hypothetical protein AAF823_13810 [Planctomycetota bacterium]